jgi:hypothetical protein
LSHSGVLSGTLVVGRARNRLGDRVIDTLTCNGGIPGPTWSVRPGDKIRVRSINRPNLSQTAQVLPQICVPHSSGHEMGTAALGEGGVVDPETSDALHTNIHTHGLQVDPRGNSDNVYLDIAPGQYFDYRIQNSGQPAIRALLLFPHRHKAVSRQMWNGLARAITVKGAIDDVPAVKAASERLLVVNELLLDGFGQVPAPTLVPNGETPFSRATSGPDRNLFPGQRRAGARDCRATRRDPTLAHRQCERPSLPRPRNRRPARRRPECEADGSPPDIARRGQLRSFSRPQRDPDGTSCPVIPIRGERDGQ